MSRQIFQALVSVTYASLTHASKPTINSDIAFFINVKEKYMDYRHHSHSVYLMTCHLVFVTKYRKPFITDEIGDFMKEHSSYLCERLGCKLVSAETDKDHMHLLISAPPSVRPSDFVRVIKTQLSKELHIRYKDEIEKYIYGKASYFSPSYFIATTGTTSLEKIEEYINSQRTDDHKRKYVKSNKYAKKKKWAE